jgi:hypothetical protein
MSAGGGREGVGGGEVVVVVVMGSPTRRSWPREGKRAQAWHGRRTIGRERRGVEGRGVERVERGIPLGAAVSGWGFVGWMSRLLKVVLWRKRGGGGEMWGFCGKGRRFGKENVGFSLKGRRFVATHPSLGIGVWLLGVRWVQGRWVLEVGPHRM